MYAVRVMPVAKGIFRDYLTFFSREALEPGSVIETPVRGRNIPAIVISSRDVREEKLDIRSADFALKKIDVTKSHKRIFSESFMRALADSSEWHGVHEGVLTAALTSTVILSSISKLEEAPRVPHRTTDADLKVRADLLVLQSEREERVRIYRNIAREAFARNASVVVVAPTVIEAETLSSELSRGIEERVALITGEMTKKKLLTEWNRAVSSKEPLLIIGTPVVLSLPRVDADTIIIERESARAYRGIQRPYVDVRRFAESLSRHSGARLILADFPLRVETRYRVDIHEVEELSRSQMRPAGNEKVIIFDSRAKEEKRGEKRIFSALSKETKEVLRAEIKKGGRALIFAARRGIAPLTVCNDCGTPITDPETGAPMSLHKTASGNVFISHRSGAILPAGTSCKTCGGWNLVTLGIGVDKVYEEIKKEFPEAPVILFTKDTAPAHKTAKKLMQDFYSKSGAILVGTERMLPYLAEPVELAVVASIDSMLSLPAWRAHETALSILFYLRERAQNAFLIETRKPDSEVMKTISSGNPADFYRSDIAEREQFSYPPFSVFIGITSIGTRASAEKSRVLISESFKEYDLVGPLPAEAVGKNEWKISAVIRLERGAWPDAALSEKLKSLPPDIAVAIDPDQIV